MSMAPVPRGASDGLKWLSQKAREAAPYLELFALVIGLLMIFGRFASEACEAGAKFCREKVPQPAPRPAASDEPEAASERQENAA